MEAAVKPTVLLERRERITVRAVVLGLALVPILIWWIHHAEFRLGGTMGHTALANTSLPVAAFFSLMVLTHCPERNRFSHLPVLCPISR